MSDLEQAEKLKQLMAADAEIAELYQAVEEFLNNIGKESALYPTRSFIQVDTIEVQKLARVFYRHIS